MCGTSSDTGQDFCQRGQISIAVLSLSDLLADIIASIGGTSSDAGQGFCQRGQISQSQF